MGPSGIEILRLGAWKLFPTSERNFHATGATSPREIRFGRVEAKQAFILSLWSIDRSLSKVFIFVIMDEYCEVRARRGYFIVSRKKEFEL